MKKIVLFMVSALAVVLCSSCDQQAEQQLQNSVLGNYCEVTVLYYEPYAYSDVHDYVPSDISNVVISYEGGSGTNFGTYMVPQQGDVTVSWTWGSSDYSEIFNVGSAVKMTIVVQESSASVNY
ncbi:MAG: hypothetical protein ACI30H_04555 [Paludibacteraceae bacterium]